MIYNFAHMVGVVTFKKLINIDAEEVCNFAHIETIRLHEKKIKTVSICPHYHPTTQKRKIITFKTKYHVRPPIKKIIVL